MIKLSPTNLWAVKVPEDARGFCKHENGGILYLYGRGLGNMCSSINLKFDEHDILGTVTKDEIDFDATPFLQVHTTSVAPVFKDEYADKSFSQIITAVFNGEETNPTSYSYWDYTAGMIGNVQTSGISVIESFRSLLASNGLYFENPFPKPADDDYSFYTDRNISVKEEWEQAEKSLVKKLLILQEIK
jgi:hypothetical protein